MYGIARNGAVVDCVVSIGLVLGQQKIVGISRSGTGVIMDCRVSVGLILWQM